MSSLASELRHRVEVLEYAESRDQFNNLNEKNFEYKIGNFLSPIINKHFIKFSNPKKFQNTTYTFKDIIEVLELEDNS